jgi:hypothetical protein
VSSFVERSDRTDFIEQAQQRGEVGIIIIRENEMELFLEQKLPFICR